MVTQNVFDGTVFIPTNFCAFTMKSKWKYKKVILRDSKFRRAIKLFGDIHTHPIREHCNAGNMFKFEEKG